MSIPHEYTYHALGLHSHGMIVRDRKTFVTLQSRIRDIVAYLQSSILTHHDTIQCYSYERNNLQNRTHLIPPRYPSIVVYADLRYNRPLALSQALAVSSRFL